MSIIEHLKLHNAYLDRSREIVEIFSRELAIGKYNKFDNKKNRIHYKAERVYHMPSVENFVFIDVINVNSYHHSAATIKIPVEMMEGNDVKSIHIEAHKQRAAMIEDFKEIEAKEAKKTEEKEREELARLLKKYEYTV